MRFGEEDCRERKNPNRRKRKTEEEKEERSISILRTNPLSPPPVACGLNTSLT